MLRKNFIGGASMHNHSQQHDSLQHEQLLLAQHSPVSQSHLSHLQF